jgi:hypothetical protein
MFWVRVIIMGEEGETGETGETGVLGESYHHR